MFLKTGHFQALEGNFAVTNGVLKSERIASIGQNLSLYLSGDIDMITNYTDVKILGKLSKKVTGLLGPLGSLSLNTFIDFVPSKGFIPSRPDKGLIELIPGLSEIPVLGLKGGEYRLFAVNIQGNFYDTGSVKRFRWIDKSDFKDKKGNAIKP